MLVAIATFSELIEVQMARYSILVIFSFRESEHSIERFDAVHTGFADSYMVNPTNRPSKAPLSFSGSTFPHPSTVVSVT